MYQPSDRALKSYAQVLINFALWSGRGVKKGEVVYLQFDSPALPLALACYRAILEAGAHPIVRQNEEDFSPIFYDLANDSQLTFFPKDYSKALVDLIDHRVYLMADRDPMLLKSVPPRKLMQANKSRELMKKWLFEKEDAGKLTWTLALYGTPGMAKEAGLSLEEYWGQIESAVFLNTKNPVATWRKTNAELEKIRQKLSDLPIDKLHLTARDTDLWIKLGENRKWMGGSGRNIPSFELFTSPDWRGTEGHIFFDLPLYRYGNIVRDIHLTFKNGRVVSSKAGKNQPLLRELIAQKNADKIGEYSLTDKRYSKINKFMADTLFDENFGGSAGNTHLALGSSYHDAYIGNMAKMKEADWEKLGFNESPEHTDIIGTTDREVEATLKNGVKKVIYKNGEFTI